VANERTRLSRTRTQQRVPAERLDQGFFTGENHEQAFPVYRCDIFQPPAERWRWAALNPSRSLMYERRCRLVVLRVIPVNSVSWQMQTTACGAACGSISVVPPNAAARVSLKLGSTCLSSAIKRRSRPNGA
jgi:hypothetical protein